MVNGRKKTEWERKIRERIVRKSDTLKKEGRFDKRGYKTEKMSKKG